MDEQNSENINTKAKNFLTDISFSHEGAHLAYTTGAGAASGKNDAYLFKSLGGDVPLSEQDKALTEEISSLEKSILSQNSDNTSTQEKLNKNTNEENIVDKETAKPTESAETVEKNAQELEVLKSAMDTLQKSLDVAQERAQAAEEKAQAIEKARAEERIEKAKETLTELVKGWSTVEEASVGDVVEALYKANSCTTIISLIESQEERINKLKDEFGKEQGVDAEIVPETEDSSLVNKNAVEALLKARNSKKDA